MTRHPIKTDGQRHGGADCRQGYQAARRIDGCRLETGEAPAISLFFTPRQWLVIAVVGTIIAIAANGDLILRAMQ